MTQEDKDLIYGRAKREEKEARQHLRFLLEDVAHVSTTLGQFSGIFRHNSHLMRAQGNEFVVVSPVDDEATTDRFSHSDFDAERIVILIRDLEIARERLQRAEVKVRELGG